ncbi:MAG: hypothetical protein K2O37_04925, partial [Bacteroidales bacterium]|nr:hypothetical protein [Bacteroidales bacterium]
PQPDESNFLHYSRNRKTAQDSKNNNIKIVHLAVLRFAEDTGVSAQPYPHKYVRRKNNTGSRAASGRL